MRFLVDANVVIYTRDFRDQAKQEAATRWLRYLVERDAAVVNRQVLNEVCHVALRKLQHLGPENVRRWIEDLSSFGSSLVDAETAETAWPIHDHYRFSWFDCLILSSADRLGCTHVLTEDMGSPRRVGPLQLVNPFTAEPDDVLAAS